MFWSVIESYNGLGFSLRHCHKLFCELIHLLLNYNSNNLAFMKKKCGCRLSEPKAKLALLTAFQ